jgi:hypothetical protein
VVEADFSKSRLRLAWLREVESDDDTGSIVSFTIDKGLTHARPSESEIELLSNTVGLSEHVAPVTHESIRVLLDDRDVISTQHQYDQLIKCHTSAHLALPPHPPTPAYPPQRPWPKL